MIDEIRQLVTFIGELKAALQHAVITVLNDNLWNLLTRLHNRHTDTARCTDMPALCLNIRNVSLSLE